MKFIFYLFSFSLYLIGFDFEYKGNIALDYKEFDYDMPYIDDKFQKTTLAEIELFKNSDEFTIFTKLESLRDDDENITKYNERNFLTERTSFKLIDSAITNVTPIDNNSDLIGDNSITINSKLLYLQNVL